MAVNARGDAKSLKRTHVAQHRGRFYVNSNVILNSRIIQSRVLNQSVISKTLGENVPSSGNGMGKGNEAGACLV